MSAFSDSSYDFAVLRKNIERAQKVLVEKGLNNDLDYNQWELNETLWDLIDYIELIDQTEPYQLRRNAPL
jgi:hypothetical protein